MIFKFPTALCVHTPWISLPFIFADADTEAVKGEMLLRRSWSRCRNREQKVVSLILSPLKQEKAMNFDQGPPDGFSGANTAAPAPLDAPHFHCAAFWDGEGKARVRTVPWAQKRLSYASGKYNLGTNVAGLTSPTWASCQAGRGVPHGTQGSGCGMHPAYTKILQWTDSERKSFEISAW